MPVLVTDIVKRVRHYLNDGHSSADIWSNTDRPDEVGIIGLISDELRQLEIKLRMGHEGYFGATSLINVVAGQEEVSLPEDFVGLTLLERVKEKSGGMLAQPIPLIPIRVLSDRYLIARARSVPSHFILWGDKIILSPVPDFTLAGFLKLWYTKRSLALTKLSDSTPVPDEYAELLAIGAAIRARLKIDRPVVELKDHYRVLMTNLEDQIENREVQMPQYVRNLDDDYFYSKGGLFIGLAGG